MPAPLNDEAGWLSRYAPIAAGLLIGTAAKYGLTINEGRKLTWRAFIADMLLLGVIGLLALSVSDWLGLQGNPRVFVASMAAVSSDRLLRIVKRSFEQAVQVQAERVAGAAGSTGNEPLKELGTKLAGLASKYPDLTMMQLLERLKSEPYP